MQHMQNEKGSRLPLQHEKGPLILTWNSDEPKGETSLEINHISLLLAAFLITKLHELLHHPRLPLPRCVRPPVGILPFRQEHVSSIKVSKNSTLPKQKWTGKVLRYIFFCLILSNKRSTCYLVPCLCCEKGSLLNHPYPGWGGHQTFCALGA